MVSPELYLTRPYDANDKKPNKLMDVLLYKAKQGVLVNILIFKEVSMAMSNNSKHTKKSFDGLHENIKVKIFLIYSLDFKTSKRKF